MKKTIQLILITIILVNVIFYFHKRNSTPKITQAIEEGQYISSSSLDYDKATLYIYLSPDCQYCVEQEENIKSLFSTFNKNFTFIGLCNNMKKSNEYFEKFDFTFIKTNSNIREDLHLAGTPQMILLENNKVLFSSKLNVHFSSELERLVLYLRKKFNYEIQ